MDCLAIDDEDAPAAVDHRGNIVIDTASKIVERVPRREDIAEHMEREVFPFAPDFKWNDEDVKIGYEIPMTRLFYKPEEVESLEELDAAIEEKLALIRSLFEEVKK